jgi:DNA-binding MarR family transcriptional regulator
MDAPPELSPLAREIKKRKPFALPAEEAYLNLMRTQACLAAECEQLFKRFGLSSPKYNVLRILRGAADTGEAGSCGLPSLEVAARLITRVPDITRLVDSLQADGLVTRTRCTEDRRVVYVGITPAGVVLAELGQEPDQLGDLARGQHAEAVADVLRQGRIQPGQQVHAGGAPDAR